LGCYTMFSSLRTAGAAAAAAAAALVGSPTVHAEGFHWSSPGKISKKEWTKCTVRKTAVSSKGVVGKTGPTKRITFGCDCGGLTPVSMVFVRPDNIKGHKFYNPVDTRPGEFDLEVKLYETEDGKKGQFGVSGKLHNAIPGDVFEVKGPYKQFGYTERTYNEVVVIAGGTGITPSFQLIKQIVENSEDTTHVVLIFANHGASSIPLKEELQALQAKHSCKFTVHFVVNDGTASEQSWPGAWHNGLVDLQLLQKTLPDSSAVGTKIYVCGPGSMMEAVSGNKHYKKGGPPQQGPLVGALAELGFTSEQVHKI